MKSSNIVSLKNFKRLKQESLQRAQVSEYLNVLSFSELINETHHTVNEIIKKPLDNDLNSRTILILKEFEIRLRNQPAPFAKSLKTMRDQLRNRISTLTL